MTHTVRSKSKRPTSKKQEPRKSNVVLLDVSPAPPPTKPRDWDDIKLGSLVLAYDQPSGGYFEGVVINDIDGLFRVQFREYPKERPVMCRREQLGLLRPDIEEPQEAA